MTTTSLRYSVVDDATVTTTNAETDIPFTFPCLEQPLRVTLHCNGLYLWTLRGRRKKNNARVLARPSRSAAKDEFRLEYSGGNNNNNNNNGVVQIHNHKFGGTLSVVWDESSSRHKVVCVKTEQEQQEQQRDEEESLILFDSSANSAANGMSDSNPPSTNFNGDDDNGEDEEEAFNDEPAILDTSLVTEEDRQWCFIRGNNNKVRLLSVKTGHYLGIEKTQNNNNGIVVLVSEENLANNDENLEISTAWDIDCVTGELCFVSSPRLDARLRCDMAGLLTMTSAWKGWEVFRFMEASHGYVKISSWMHAQWLLASTADGTVTTCRHAESLVDNNDDGRLCSQWAIESSSQGEGVVIRSKTHGRLLSVRDGGLRTYSPNDPPQAELSGETTTPDDTTSDDINTSEEQSSLASFGASGRQWLNNSVKSVNSSVRNMQRRWSSASLKSENSEDRALPESVPQEETLVWQLEAAHQQTYYFSSLVEGQVPKTIGSFPHVTPNLRRTDKIQLQRKVGTATTLLFETEKKKYIACSATGSISFVESDQVPETEWIKPPSHQGGGNVFRSNLHNLYLSYKDLEREVPDSETTSENTTDAKAKIEGQLRNLFGNKQEGWAELIGSPDMGEREVWRLEPCMPRAVSSEKITTFAIGTSIAIGTTIAMPFALAGAGAVLGAFGAEAGVLFNVIAAGLTGVEALASVGAIGATAYIVFRPDENSLTDDDAKEQEEEERAWSKRPFSNWRNW